jgi:hypothetical protein
MFILLSFVSFAQLTPKLIGTNESDVGFAIRQLDDGFIIGGYTDSAVDSSKQIFLLKVSNDLDTIWTKQFGDSLDNRVYDMGITPNSDYVLAGWTRTIEGNTAGLIAKTDSSGSVIWMKTLDQFGSNYFQKMEMLKDGNYAVIGTTPVAPPSQQQDFWLVKYNSQGDTLWSRTYGGVNMEYAYNMKETWDGGFVMCGTTYNSFGNDEFIGQVMRTDSIGDTLWTQTISDIDCSFHCLCVASDSSIILLGTVQDSILTDSYDYNWLIKLDSSGDTLWSKRNFYTTNSDNYARREIRETIDGGFITTFNGKMNLDSQLTGHLVKYSFDGVVEWVKNYRVGLLAFYWDVIQKQDGGYAVVGTGYDPNFPEKNDEVFVMVVDSEGELTAINSIVTDDDVGELATIFPNPTTGKVTIQTNNKGTITLIDVTGKQVLQNQISGSSELDFSTYKSGMYIFRFEGENDEIEYHKLVKE